MTPERCIAGLLCAAIGRLSGDADGRHGSDSSSDGEGAESSLDPEEAARRMQLVREGARCTPSFRVCCQPTACAWVCCACLYQPSSSLPQWQIEAAVDAPTLEGLINGTHQLPHSDLVGTPEPAPCVGGCAERYCSAACARAAWDGYHCLLCPVGQLQGGGSGDPKGKGKGAAVGSSSGGGGAAGSSSGAASGSGRSAKGASGSGSGSKGKKVLGAAAKREAAETVHGVQLRRGRLEAFLEHADDSNDMFRLAAQVLAIVLVSAHSQLQQLRPNDSSQPEEAAAGEAPAATEQQRGEALRRAWLPFAVAEKAPYWEVAAVEKGAGDGEEDDDEEEEVRAHIKELTRESLALLKAAWVGTEWPELLDLQVGFVWQLGSFGSFLGTNENSMDVSSHNYPPTRCTAASSACLSRTIWPSTSPRRQRCTWACPILTTAPWTRARGRRCGLRWVWGGRGLLDCLLQVHQSHITHLHSSNAPSLTSIALITNRPAAAGAPAAGSWGRRRDLHRGHRLLRPPVLLQPQLRAKRGRRGRPVGGGPHHGTQGHRGGGGGGDLVHRRGGGRPGGAPRRAGGVWVCVPVRAVRGGGAGRRGRGGRCDRRELS